MNLRKLHNSLVSSQLPLIMFIILAFALRFFAWVDWSSVPMWGTLLLHLCIALLILRINHKYTIIRTRTMLPAIFYLLMSGANPMFYSAWEGSLSALGALLCLSYLFGSYQNSESQVNALNIGIVITLCGFFWPPVFLFFPLIWYGLFNFQSLNYKTFAASIVGILVVFLFIFSWSIYNGGTQFFIESIPNWREILTIHQFSFNIYDIAIFIFLFVLFILSGFNIYVSGLSEKIRTGTYLKYIYLSAVCVFLVMVLQSNWKVNWALVLFIPVSFILAHYFTLTTNKLSFWLLFLTIIFFFGIYICQVFLNDILLGLF